MRMLSPDTVSSPLEASHLWKRLILLHKSYGVVQIVKDTVVRIGANRNYSYDKTDTSSRGCRVSVEMSFKFFGVSNPVKPFFEQLEMGPTMDMDFKLNRLYSRETNIQVKSTSTENLNSMFRKLLSSNAVMIYA